MVSYSPADKRREVGDRRVRLKERRSGAEDRANVSVNLAALVRRHAARASDVVEKLSDTAGDADGEEQLGHDGGLVEGAEDEAVARCEVGVVAVGRDGGRKMKGEDGVWTAVSLWRIWFSALDDRRKGGHAPSPSSRRSREPSTDASQFHDQRGS